VTPDLDQLAQTIASFTDKPAHATLFKKITLKNTDRREAQTDTAGVPAVYNFGLEMVFDPTHLKNTN